MRETKADEVLREPASAAGTVIAVMVLATGSKSKSLDGLLSGGVSALKITWPLGRMAPGASSALMPPGMAGPAAQELVEGVYRALEPVDPTWKARPSGSSAPGPMSWPELVSATGIFP